MPVQIFPWNITCPIPLKYNLKKPGEKTAGSFGVVVVSINYQFIAYIKSFKLVLFTICRFFRYKKVLVFVFQNLRFFYRHTNSFGKGFPLICIRTIEPNSRTILLTG